MSTTIPAGRLQLSETAAKPYAAMLRLSGAVELDHGLRELIDIRASQINGCAFCIDMHWKDARAGGESEQRLYMLDAWRESALYSDRERAALELCEAVTLIAGDDVPDDVWERTSAHFTSEEMAQLVFAIATINTWNRLMISVRGEPGHYQPGDFAPRATAA